MTETDADTLPPRMLSLLPEVGKWYWTAGKSGKLMLQRNRHTGRWLHPFWRVAVDDPDTRLEAVSGKATVFTFTVNLHTYNPQVKPPYVIAMVQLPEQEDLRLVTNIVNCAPDKVEIGMKLRLLFEQHGEYFLPVFEPDPAPPTEPSP